MNGLAYILSTLTIFFLFNFFIRITYAYSIVLNEIMPQSEEDLEWVELYNPTSETISLDGWTIKDNNTITTDDIKLTGSLNPSEIKTFERSKGWLNDSGDGDTVTLVDQNGSVIDTHAYKSSTINKTIGRVPDNGTWQDGLTASKGTSNNQSTPTPTASTSTTTTNETTTQTQSLVISNIPTNIKSTDSFNINVSLSVTSAQNTNFYLKGAFYKEGETNYFGKTKVSGNWIKNSDSATNQFKITTDNSGNWSGNLEVMTDMDDTGYKSSGTYKIKVGRYNSDGTGLFWSNDKSISVENIATPIPTTSISSKSTSTPKPSSTNISNESKTASESTNTSHNSSADNSDEYKIPNLSPDDPSQVLGTSTISTTKIKSNKAKNWFFILGGFIILILGGVLFYKFYLKKKLNHGI